MPVPPFSRRPALPGSAFDTSSNPGIRRPRWGGVVEGVVVFRHPLAYEKEADRLSGLASSRK